MRRVVPAILLLTVLLVGGGLVATVAYQAGLSASVTTVAAPSGTVVVPAYGYGYGWHFFGPGFGFLGFLGTILFLFIVFGLVRAVVFGFGRRSHDGHGWGPGMRDAYRAPLGDRRPRDVRGLAPPRPRRDGEAGRRAPINAAGSVRLSAATSLGPDRLAEPGRPQNLCHAPPGLFPGGALRLQQHYDANHANRPRRRRRAEDRRSSRATTSSTRASRC